MFAGPTDRQARSLSIIGTSVAEARDRDAESAGRVTARTTRGDRADQVRSRTATNGNARGARRMAIGLLTITRWFAVGRTVAGPPPREGDPARDPGLLHVEELNLEHQR